MGDAFVKDYQLTKLDLTPVSGKPINLRNVLVQLDIFECLFDNNTTAALVVNDANNLIMNLPLYGFETLDVEFQTPDKEAYSKTFRLMRITDRGLVKERQSVYTLQFVTPEAITNLTTRVSKSYKGKLISDIVTDLHNNFLSDTTINNVEETQDQHHIIIPNLNPSHAINWLCTRSISAQYNGASYLYYEDKYGFNFLSVEYLLSQDSSKTYTYHVGNVRRDNGEGHKDITYESDLISVEQYKINNHSDILDNIRHGMYANELLTQDAIKKTWTRYTFNYQTSFDDYQHLYAGNPLDSQSSDLDESDARLKLHPTGQDEYPFLPEQWLPVRQSQMQQLQNLRLTVTIPGDSERTIGEIVEFDMPSAEPPINNMQITEKYLSGRYLVHGVRHKIDMDKYLTTLELVKDSVAEQYP